MTEAGSGACTGYRALFSLTRLPAPAEGPRQQRCTSRRFCGGPCLGFKAEAPASSSPAAVSPPVVRTRHSLHSLLSRCAGRCSPPPHSLHWLLVRWCGQMLASPHFLHVLLMRWCGQMLAPPALLAVAPPALVRADARPPALLAVAPPALVLPEARPPALLACAPGALVLADARPPALLALTPSALVRTDTARLLLRGASRCVGLSEPPSLAHAGCRRLCRRGALLAGARGDRVHQREECAAAADKGRRGDGSCADARPPALLAFAPLALMRTDTARLLLRGASRSVGPPEPPPLAHNYCTRASGGGPCTVYTTNWPKRSRARPAAGTGRTS